MWKTVSRIFLFALPNIEIRTPTAAPVRLFELGLGEYFILHYEAVSSFPAFPEKDIFLYAPSFCRIVHHVLPIISVVNRFHLHFLLSPESPPIRLCLSRSPK
jgi:hypothetical protein